MQKILLSIFIYQFTVLVTFSQVSTIWERRYNGLGNSYDEATSIAVDASGNVYVAGASTGTGGKNFEVVKYNSSGTLLWASTYNGPGNGIDDAYLIKIDNSGNVYVTGASTGSGTGLDYCVVKYNSSGSQQWVYRYNGPANTTDEVYSLQIDGSGNVYITGYSNGGASGEDACTIKINSSGVHQWVKRYNGTANNDDYGNSVQLDNSGNSYVTCTATQSGTDQDYLTIKYDANGNQLWTAFYNGPGNGVDFPSSNAIDANGNIYVTGYSVGNSTDRDYCTIKYNNNGQQQWAARYDGPDGFDEAFNIVLDNQGNVYVTGNSAGVGTGDDYCTIKYNNSGQQQWIARHTGPGASNDYCNWVAIDPTGNVYVTGVVGEGTGNAQDIVTIGYNSSGVQQWLQTYNGTGNEFDSGNSLTVDNQGNVYITGGSDSPNNTDFITIKYSSTIGINPVSSEIPATINLSQNYPNPFNPVTEIRFDIPKSSFTSIKIYDALGGEISTLVNEELKAGKYEVSWDASLYPSGIYFYRIAIHSDKIGSSDYTETKKMVLVK